MPWYVYAFSAAVMWGVHYNLLSIAMRALSPITAYWMPTIIMVVGIPLLKGSLIRDFHRVMEADWKIQSAVALISFTGFIATTCLYKAIQSHNPVHAGLIEITFPIFVAAFGLIMLGQNHFNWGTIVGGSLIMIGAGIVIYTQ